MDINPSEKNNEDLGDVLITSNFKYDSSPAAERLIRSGDNTFRIRLIFGAIALVAIALTAFFFSGDGNETPLSSDEADQIQLFVSRNRELLPWKKGFAIEKGDQLAVKILSEKPAVAWMDLYQKTGKPSNESPSHNIATININPSIAQEFSKKFSINQTVKGQVLVVLICARKSLDGLQPTPGELADWMDGIYNHDQEFMNGCAGSRIPLGP